MINPPVFGAYNVHNGLDANKPLRPKMGDLYIATDTKQLLVCFEKVGFDIFTAVLSQSIVTQDDDPTDLAFNADGSKMYEIGYGGKKIYEYVLSTPFDISTAFFSQSIDSQDSHPFGLAFNADGSKMYEIGNYGDKIYEYVLSTPFDISTAVFSQSIDTQDDSPRGLAFNADGSKMYEIGSSTDKIYEYVLSTPFDISTAVLSQSIGTQDRFPSGLAFNADGSKMYEIGLVTHKIYEYVLSTPFDISTAVLSQSIASQDNQPFGLAFNAGGLKMYEVGSERDKIYEYTLQAVGKWEEYKTTPDMVMISSENYTFEDSQIPSICSGSHIGISETQARTGTKCLRCLTRSYGSTPGDGSNGTAYGIEVLKISSPIGIQGIELFFKSPDTDHQKTLSVKFYDEEHNLLQEFPHPSAYTVFKAENISGDITVELDIQWISLSKGAFYLYVDDLKVDTLV